MALLDWEKAFDKVQHDKLYIAMERLGFSKHYIDVIEDYYMNPASFVRDNFGTSEKHTIHRDQTRMPAIAISIRNGHVLHRP